MNDIVNNQSFDINDKKVNEIFPLDNSKKSHEGKIENEAKDKNIDEEDEAISKVFLNQTISKADLSSKKTSFFNYKNIIIIMFLTTIAVILIALGIKYVVKRFFINDKKEKKVEQFVNAEAKPQEVKFDNFTNRNSDYFNKVAHEDSTAMPSMNLDNIIETIKANSSITNNLSSISDNNNLNARASYQNDNNNAVALSVNSKQLDSKLNIYDDRYKGADYSKVNAIKSSLDPNLTLEKGTFIPCALRTKIVTTIAGEVGCTITDDVYSSNGKVLLIEKGSKVFGTYASGELKVGEERIFVIWQEIRTPNNININIASNATGTLGESGIGGRVNEHFFKKFGTAILVSFISTSLDYLSANIADKHSKKDNSIGFLDILLGNRKDSVDDRAKEIIISILEKQSNIAPTLYKNQGDMVGIFVARDVDFSDVYELKQNDVYE